MKKIVAFLGVVILVTSCERDVVIDVPAQPIKLVVNGITRVNNAFRVTVSKTTGVLDLSDPASYRVKNAFVQLYENGVLKDTLVYDSASNSYLVKRNTRPQLGRTYLLKAASPGLTAVEAETTTPGSIAIQSITRRNNVRKDAAGNWLDEVKITFTDAAAADNFYLFRVRRPLYQGGNNINYSGIGCMHSTDKDIERRSNDDPTDFERCIDNEFYMTDKNFNGKTKEVILFITHHDLQPVLVPSSNRYVKPIVELQNITNDHYKYRKSYSAYRDAEDNPFAEPVLVYGNVKNGYGIFSTFELARDTIR